MTFTRTTPAAHCVGRLSLTVAGFLAVCVLCAWNVGSSLKNLLMTFLRGLSWRYVPPKITCLSSTLRLIIRLQKYVNRELPDVQAGFRKGRGTRDQIANICWIIEKAREFHKNIYFCFIDYDKAFYCVDHNKLWKILKEMGIPNHLTCLLRNLFAGQEATVITGHETIDGFHIGKGVVKAVYCHPAYLTYMQSTS